MKRYRIGIVGTGFGVHAHLPALRNHSRFDVVAVASPNSASEIAATHNIPSAFRSCAEMVERKELDAVAVASPPFAHRDDVIAALGKRKHVIAEKPFALNVADALAMVAAAGAAKTACGISHEFRFVSQTAALKELSENGHLGCLRNIEITLLRSRFRRNERPVRGWWFERERGGGVAGALLSHLIDLATWLADGPPTRVTGFRRTANPQRFDEYGEYTSTADDGAFALIEYANGLTARLCADGTAAVESYVCAVHGEERTAVTSGATMTSVRLYAVDRDQTDELQCKASPYARFAGINENVPLMMELYDEFVKRIEGRPNALPTFEEALRTQEALSAVGYEV